VSREEGPEEDPRFHRAAGTHRSPGNPPDGEQDPEQWQRDLFGHLNSHLGASLDGPLRFPESE
jgi:hypothetical protein